MPEYIECDPYRTPARQESSGECLQPDFFGAAFIFLRDFSERIIYQLLNISYAAHNFEIHIPLGGNEQSPRTSALQ